MYVTWIDELGLRELEIVAKGEDISGAALPETWFQDNPPLLLSTKRASNGCTREEQHAAVAWLLGLFTQTDKSEEMEWPSSLPQVQRKIVSTKKHAACVQLAKKYCQGMAASGGYTYLDFLDRFAMGSSTM